MRDAIIAFVVTLVLAALVIGLWVGFYYHPIITSAVVAPLVILLIVYLWNSIGSVGPDEVALRVWFGEPEERIFYSGLVFVPWFFNIRFNGRTLCELARIPRGPRNFAIQGSLEDAVWSRDHQEMIVDITGFVRFPYDEPNSLVQVVQAGVPTDEAALQARAKPEIVAGVRDVLAEYDHDQAISKSNLTAIRRGVQEFVLLPSGWFAANGICGNDVTNFTPGTGEVIVRVETVRVEPRLKEGMQAPVVAEYQKKAAKHQAEASAILFDDTNQALRVWLEGQRAAGHEPTQAQIEAKQEELRQRALAKTPGYQQVHIKGLEGATTAVVGGGGAGVMLGVSGGQQTPPNAPGGSGSPPIPPFQRRNPKK